MMQQELPRHNWDNQALEEATTRRGMMSFGFGRGDRVSGDLGILARIKSLRQIAFGSSDLSEENLRALGRIPNLVRLDLKECRFSSEALAAFCEEAASNAPKFSELWLEGTGIADSDLEAVARLPKLKWLILSRTSTSDAGMHFLAEIKTLQNLWLNDTFVTDAGLLTLAPLRRVSIGVRAGRGPTEAGREALFAAQVAAHKSKRRVDPNERREAQQVLWQFLEAMRDWEADAYERAREIEERHRAARPQPNVYSHDESAENKQFWLDIGAEKRRIAARFCSPNLLARGAGSAGSYSNPPQFDPGETTVLDVESPSAGKMIFYTNRARRHPAKQRFVLKKIGDAWKLDEVQSWGAGWHRDLV